MLDLVTQREEEMIERYSTPRTVQPTYCVEEGIWFLDDGTTAKSLAALQRKLPGVFIQDYYPGGYNSIPRVVKTPVVSVPWTEPNPKPLPTIQETTFKAEPATAPKASPVPSVVEFKKVRPKRKYERSQDKVARQMTVNWRKDPEAVPTLRRLMDEGLPTAEVARRMGCTNNAIIGACHRNGISISGRKK